MVSVSPSRAATPAGAWMTQVGLVASELARLHAPHGALEITNRAPALPQRCPPIPSPGYPPVSPLGQIRQVSTSAARGAIVDAQGTTPLLLFALDAWRTSRITALLTGRRAGKLQTRLRGDEKVNVHCGRVVNQSAAAWRVSNHLTSTRAVGSNPVRLQQSKQTKSQARLRPRSPWHVIRSA